MIDLVPVEPRCLSELAIPHLQSLKPDAMVLLEMYLTSAALLVIESHISSSIPYVNGPLFSPSFRRLRVLMISGYCPKNCTVDVLHCFQCLEELSLAGVLVSTHHIYLPLVQTLKRLSLLDGSAKWLDGHDFVQLVSFSVGVPHRTKQDISFPRRVVMPVCTSITCHVGSLEFLLMVRAGIVAPRLAEWNLDSPVLSKKDFQAAKNGIKQDGIEALQQIRVRKLVVSINDYYQGLIMIITPRHELEELFIKFYGSGSAAIGLLSALMETIVNTPVIGETTDIPLQTGTANGHSINTNIQSGTGKKIICPNLKTLNLRFRVVSFPSQEMEQVRKLCTQIMEGRSRAGHPLDRCCIWEGKKEFEDDPSLVLMTSNEGVIVNGGW